MACKAARATGPRRPRPPPTAPIRRFLAQKPGKLGYTPG